MPAATIWTGPRVTHGDTDQPDKMTDNVWIMRGSLQGIYNSKQEAGFEHFLSPKDTEWADGTTAIYNTLTYTDWNTWSKINHGGPPSTVGVNAGVHLKTDDIYIDMKFLSWSSGGDYSYERSTLAAANVPPSVTITNPPNGASFTAPATFTIQASASDSDGTVTNVQFLANTSSLGSVSAPPFSVTAINLGMGSYTLTAIATDNGGLRTTSAPVNVTVGLPANQPPSVSITNPPDGSIFGNTDTVTIQTSASDTDGFGDLALKTAPVRADGSSTQIFRPV